ncbi:uncharacterized protein TRIADDRAFT_64292 [Trichoplax adhaerens]|uniref:Expressed protein n=1 Tax=Trichoplax adhaerens TaxID=10228 RepID=B3S8Q9_TRIAD|nr:expressed protein [Trichoplax adhaerens]EDV20931.1 expressed protein [Trichoplax adhaerens]|eukprot:XP_002116575.1 expressed protein [Trichoplax adhaerens]
MNLKLVLIACLLFAATVYTEEHDEIPEEIEKELADIQNAIEDRNNEENEIIEKDAELADIDEDDLKKEAVKSAKIRKSTEFNFFIHYILLISGGEDAVVDAVDAADEFSLPDVHGGTNEYL